MKAYIARDKCGDTYIYAEKPKKAQSVWTSSLWRAIHIYNSDLPKGINPQWEDDEPIEVELTIKKI